MDKMKNIGEGQTVINLGDISEMRERGEQIKRAMPQDGNEVLERILELLDDMLNMIEQQQEQISNLSKDVYELAPEKEIIDTTYLANEEERLKAIDKYMNHGRSFLPECS